jgi:hypothetical protein
MVHLTRTECSNVRPGALPAGLVVLTLVALQHRNARNMPTCIAQILCVSNIQKLAPHSSQLHGRGCEL